MARPETVVDARRAVAERNIEAILNGAERLLLAGKVLNFSAIATEAGVSRPTVYAHFAVRLQLIGALVERSVGKATEAMRSAEPERGPADDAMRRVIAIGWEHVARHQAIARAAIGELSMDALHDHHRQAEAVLERLIERGQSEGAFRDDLPASWLAVSCLAVIHAAAAAVGSGQMRSEAAVGALTTTVVDLCVGGRSGRKRPR
jgi:TetR/AcrR family transcriptional repressor of mexCD-oprJ operon